MLINVKCAIYVDVKINLLLTVRGVRQVCLITSPLTCIGFQNTTSLALIPAAILLEPACNYTARSEALR